MRITRNSSYQDALTFSEKGIEYLLANHSRFAFETFGDAAKNPCYDPYKDDDLDVVNMLIGGIRTKMPKGSPRHQKLSQGVAADIHNTWVTYDWLCKACARVLQNMDF